MQTQTTALGWDQGEASLQDFKNRQNSIETDDNSLIKNGEVNKI